MAVVYFSLTTNLLKKYVYFSSFAIFIIFFLTQFEVNVNELTPGFDLLLFKSSLSGFQQHSVSMTTGSSVARGGSDTERDAETRHRHTHTYTCALVIRFLYLCRSVRGCRSMTMLDWINRSDFGSSSPHKHLLPSIFSINWSPVKGLSFFTYFPG